ncbi:MAG: hypothetical protein LUH53_02880 [Lachnospiraceae bacterium]|nr:hypothetical protein [Lachnospiraceae bacterium]
MSRKRSEEEYQKTRSFRLRQWLEGEKDPFLDTVEMKNPDDQEKNPESVKRTVPAASGETAVHTNGQKTKRKGILKQSGQGALGMGGLDMDGKRIASAPLSYEEEKKARVATWVYNSDRNRDMRAFRGIYRACAAVFCVFLLIMLLTAVSWLPTEGVEDRPVNNEVSARYIESGLQETGAVNIVTGMILDYRAFDTLGESHVLFAATMTVLILLRLDDDEEKKKQHANDRLYEPKNDVILQTVAKILVPFIFIFGIYVILCGHLGPGGGFSGGAVIGAGLILYVNAFGFAKTERFFTAKTYMVTSFTALACYSLSKCYSFYTGANGIESVIPLGTPGAILSSGLIFVLNICVGIVVAGTMYTFYAMFRKGGY